MTKLEATESEALTEDPAETEAKPAEQGRQPDYWELREMERQAKQERALADLRAPFPPDMISKLPRGKSWIDFVGHADLTHRLLDVDPFWNWTPAAYDELGRPAMDYTDKGQPIGMWIKLTVAGVTRLGYGSCTPGKNDAVKELIGDALRNAAMRFGAALDLWSKSDRAEAAKTSTDPGLQTVREDVHRAMENRPPAEPFVEGPTEDLTPFTKKLTQPQRSKLLKWWSEQPFPKDMTAAAVPELFVDRIKAAIERISNGEPPAAVES